MSDPRRNLSQEKASSLVPLRADAAGADTARAIGRSVVVALHARRRLASPHASSAKAPTMTSKVTAHEAHRNPGPKCARPRVKRSTTSGRFILAVHDIPRPVRASRVLSAAGSSSLRRPRAQITGETRRTNGRASGRRGSVGKAGKSMSFELDVLRGFPPRLGRLRHERE